MKKTLYLTLNLLLMTIWTHAFAHDYHWYWTNTTSNPVNVGWAENQDGGGEGGGDTGKIGNFLGTIEPGQEIEIYCPGCAGGKYIYWFVFQDAYNPHNTSVFSMQRAYLYTNTRNIGIAVDSNCSSHGCGHAADQTYVGKVYSLTGK